MGYRIYIDEIPPLERGADIPPAPAILSRWAALLMRRKPLDRTGAEIALRMGEMGMVRKTIMVAVDCDLSTLKRVRRHAKDEPRRIFGGLWRMRCETLTHSGAYIDLKPYAASRRPHGGMWGTLLVKSVARAYLVARAKGGLIRTLRF